MSRKEELVKKLNKKYRTFTEARLHHVYQYDDTFLIVCSDEVKGEYSYHNDAKAIYIREDLYNMHSEIVEYKAYTAYNEHCRLIDEAKAQGLPHTRMNAKFKKESTQYAKEQTLLKYGEEDYYKTFGDERKKKAKSEKKEIRKTIKANKEVIKSMELPKALDVKVDDILVKQVEEAVKINYAFQEEKALLDDFDNDTIVHKDVDIKVVAQPEPPKEEIVEPYDFGLTDDEREELVDDIFNDSFSLDDFLSGDLF